jgi:serine/threonine protein kinase
MEASSKFSAREIGGLQVLSEDGGFAFCRGWRDGAVGRRSGVLVALPVSEQPTPGSLDRLTHEYALKDELDSTWAVRPLDLMQDRGRTILVLEDPGGELLSARVGDDPMQVGDFLHIAVGVAGALDKLHQRGLIHKDIKPANILVNATSDGCDSPALGLRRAFLGNGSRLPLPRSSLGHWPIWRQSRPGA